VAIEIRETFQVQAPIDAVWRFVMDPQQVVTCMPGAALDQVVDDRTFLGNVRVKVGAITASYKGRVQLAHVDHQGYTLQMVAEGRETGGGMAKGTISSRLHPLSAGQTEVVAEASVDLTGRLMQVGRGMIQGVAQQLFQQFIASVKQRLEVPAAALEESGLLQPATAADPSITEPQAIRVVPLLLRTLWSAILRFFRRLVGRNIQK
jgi:carbon monoxide dehydrogenase subunit G